MFKKILKYKKSIKTGRWVPLKTTSYFLTATV